MFFVIDILFCMNIKGDNIYCDFFVYLFVWCVLGI